MTDNTVNVTLTEDEIKQIASGDVSIALRKKLGYEGLVVTVTLTYDVVYDEEEPLDYYDKNGNPQPLIFTVDELDKALEENKESVKNAILVSLDDFEVDCSVTLSYGDKTVEVN